MKRTTHTQKRKRGRFLLLGRSSPSHISTFFMHQFIFKPGFSKATKDRIKMDLSPAYKKRTILVYVKIAIKNVSGFYKATLN